MSFPWQLPKLYHNICGWKFTRNNKRNRSHQSRFEILCVCIPVFRNKSLIWTDYALRPMCHYFWSKISDIYDERTNYSINTLKIQSNKIFWTKKTGPKCPAELRLIGNTVLCVEKRTVVNRFSMQYLKRRVTRISRSGHLAYIFMVGGGGIYLF